MHGRSPHDHRPSRPSNAGTQQVKLAPTRPTLCESSAKRREVFRRVARRVGCILGGGGGGGWRGYLVAEYVVLWVPFLNVCKIQGLCADAQR